MHGEIETVSGPGSVVDVRFSDVGRCLAIRDALLIRRRAQRFEVGCHTPNEPGLARTLAMEGFAGLCRGLRVDSHRRADQPCQSAPRSSSDTSSTVSGESARWGTDHRSVRGSAPPSIALRCPCRFRCPSTQLLETGLKAVDLLCPVVRGGKTGLFGGAGVGKTVFLTERFIGDVLSLTGRRRSSRGSVNGSARAHELWASSSSAGLLDRTALVFGQMDAPPGPDCARRARR